MEWQWQFNFALYPTAPNIIISHLLSAWLSTKALSAAFSTKLELERDRGRKKHCAFKAKAFTFLLLCYHIMAMEHSERSKEKRVSLLKKQLLQVHASQ